MKKLIWKLEYKDGEYTLELRIVVWVIYFIILSPLFLICWLFKKLDKLIWNPVSIRERSVETTNHTKKARKEYFKYLSESL